MLSESPGTPTAPSVYSTSSLQNPNVEIVGSSSVDGLSTVAVEPPQLAAASSSAAASEPVAVGQQPPASAEPVLQISVVSPEKRGEGMNAYVVYKVITKAASTIMRHPETRVERRFNDFFWLQAHLTRLHPSRLTPPLPEKTGVTMMAGGKFSPEFLEFRRRELERFLRRVAAHPQLSIEPDFVAFLESTDEKFALLKQKMPEESAAAAGGTGTITSPPEAAPAQGSSGFFTFFSSTVSKVAALSTTLVQGPAEEVDKWFEVRGVYFNALEQNLGTVARSIALINRRNKEMVEALLEASTSTSLVSDNESTADKSLSEAFARLSGAFSTCASFYKDNSEFEEVLKDYIRYLQAVKELLKRRSDSLASWQSIQRSLQSSRERLKLVAAPATKQKLEADIAADEKVEAQRKQYFEQFSVATRAELERFEAQKGRELRTLVVGLVQNNINQELQTVDAWKNVLQQIQ